MKKHFKSAIILIISGATFGAGFDLCSNGHYLKLLMLFAISGSLLLFRDKINHTN